MSNVTDAPRQCWRIMPDFTLQPVSLWARRIAYPGRVDTWWIDERAQVVIVDDLARGDYFTEERTAHMMAHARAERARRELQERAADAIACEMAAYKAWQAFEERAQGE